MRVSKASGPVHHSEEQVFSGNDPLDNDALALLASFFIARKVYGQVSEGGLFYSSSGPGSD
jgi:hypothetical protein